MSMRCRIRPSGVYDNPYPSIKRKTAVRLASSLSSQTRTPRGLSPSARGILKLLLRARVALAIDAVQIIVAAFSMPGNVARMVMLLRHLEDGADVVQLQKRMHQPLIADFSG